jgi:chorismate mutase
MIRNRHMPMLIAGSLVISLLVPATADAEPVNTMYKLVDVASQRLATADPVAANKWINGGPITDPQRAAAVLDQVAGEARAHGIDEQYVRTIFTDQVSATEGLEYTRFGQWKFDPATAPKSAPDLSASRSQIDGYNTTMVDEIARLWNSLHSPGCDAELSSAKAAVIADRHLDPLYQQALSSATRSYCRLT